MKANVSIGQLFFILFLAVVVLVLLMWQPAKAQAEPEATEDVLYVYMVYQSKFGQEYPVGQGHLVYLYDAENNQMTTHIAETNSQSIAVLDDVPFDTYNIYGIFNLKNPFYSHICEKNNVTIDQEYWTEKLVCVPIWKLNFPWLQGS